MKACQLFFILYFTIIAIFPYLHNHADSEPRLVCSDGSVYSSEHGDFYIPDIRHDEHYAVSHRSHDDRHIHFLTENSNPASGRLSARIKTQLELIEIPEKIVIMQSSHYSVITMICNHARSFCDSFYSPYYGLSPPSC